MNNKLNYTSILAKIIAVIITLTLHEFSKAFISSKLGDKLPEKEGRLTLNPLKHLEPIGALSTFLFGFGWGNPVNTSAIFYKDKKKGTLLTYGMPSVINILFGLILKFIFVFINLKISFINYLINYLIFCNVAVGIFNIIPVYPCDGAKILTVFLKPNQIVKFYNYEKIYQLILIFLTLYGPLRIFIYDLVFRMTGMLW